MVTLPLLVVEDVKLAVHCPQLVKDNKLKKRIVKVKFLGACNDCSMSAMTLKGGVEEVIKKSVPEIKKVIAVEEILNQ